MAIGNFQSLSEKFGIGDVIPLERNSKGEIIKAITTVEFEKLFGENLTYSGMIAVDNGIMGFAQYIKNWKTQGILS